MLSNLTILLQLSSISHNLPKYASKYQFSFLYMCNQCRLSKDLCKLFALIHQLICFNRFFKYTPMHPVCNLLCHPTERVIPPICRGPQIYIKFRVNCKECFFKYYLLPFALSIDYPYVSILPFTVYIIFRIKMRTAECQTTTWTIYHNFGTVHVIYHKYDKEFLICVKMVSG